MKLVFGDRKAKRWLDGVAAVLILTVMLFSCRVSVKGAEERDRDVREVIRAAFYGFCEAIDVSEFKILPQELAHIFSLVIKDDPYLFFVDTSMSYSFESGGCVLVLYPTYSLTGEDAFLAWEKCRDWIKGVAREALVFESDLQRALYLHDRICLFTEYDHSLFSDNIFSLVKSGRGTCQGYALAYIAALREVGIEAHFVASDSIEHIWCCLSLDGEWYHADLTWDDSASVEVGRVSRRHFLLSDRVAEQRGHRDWYSYNDVECKSDRYVDLDFDGALLHNGLGRGDVDHNGRIELRDLLMIKSELLSDGACALCADVNSDGTVNYSDVKSLRKKLLSAD